MPSLPIAEEEGGNNNYEVMDRMKMVADYCNCSIDEVLGFAVDYFQLCFKKAFIQVLQKTEKGQQYLKDCENITKTEMDVDGLDNFVGGVE